MTTLTDSTYDLSGSQYRSKVDKIIFATPFEQNPTYCMRSWNKPFQAPKWPTDGTNAYEKRQPNEIDLSNTLKNTQPPYEAKDWSKMKTIIAQKSDVKEGFSDKTKAKRRAKGPCKTCNKVKKEGYNTSPYAAPDYHTIDTWSSAGRIRDSVEGFKMLGKEAELIDIIIIILLFVFFVLICSYGYIVFSKKFKKSKEPEPEPKPESEPAEPAKQDE